ncbi:MAG: CRISPR-associated helicase Cas3' [Bacillota bacterium]
MNNQKLNQLFQTLMDRPDVCLYPYQEKASMALLSAHNVILRAPTGAGKTWAALLPFLYAKRTGIQFVDRVLYALPLRSLASQLHASTMDACHKAGWAVERAYDVTNTGGAGTKKLFVTIQTGERQEDSFFRGDIIFTTIDQLLSSYILDPVSLPGRLANINTGALLGSLLVFDEFHLLEPDKSMGTAIEMLDRLRPYCRFVLMTATLSDIAVQWLRERFGAQVIELTIDEIQFIEGFKRTPTRRKWIWSEDPLLAKTIISEHRQRSLVILNSVGRAQEIYRELVRLKPKGTDVCLLHSRFFSDDRLPKERQVILRLGKDNQFSSEDFILVSTQVVEAGMDFSVDVLHTELAPMNSLVQRAGRCVRYGGEGLVKVYPVVSVAPYGSKVVDKTADVLCRISEKVLLAQDEEEAVNAVHGSFERDELREYDNLYHRRILVAEAMDGLRPGARQELIRDVNTINVLLVSEPENVRFDIPSQWPEMLSVPYGTLRGFASKTEAGPDDWVVAVPVESDEKAESEHGLRFRWERLASAQAGLPWMVVINPRYARYSPEEGLVLGDSGQEVPVSYRSRQVQAKYHYRCETYLDHARLVLNQLEGILGRDVCTHRFLAEGLGVPTKTIVQALRLGTVLHDVGKLSVGWQNTARKWQEHKTPGRAPKEPLAHTDFDPKTDWDVRRNFPDHPAHAVEGAYAVTECLSTLFEDAPGVALCIATAIARHHSGHARTLKDYSLVSGAADIVGRFIEELGLPPLKQLLDKPDNLTCGRDGDFARSLLAAAREDDAKWLPLYWYLVRCLRLADQAGTAEGGKR